MTKEYPITRIPKRVRIIGTVIQTVAIISLYKYKLYWLIILWTFGTIMQESYIAEKGKGVSFLPLFISILLLSRVFELIMPMKEFVFLLSSDVATIVLALMLTWHRGRTVYTSYPSCT